ncbi:hypothetical protein [Prescottella equi]|uniref:hypothetical protein n=1 Tax=Rhodococcus hoagii TaxID=43767 RepID=UPI001C75405D|nr:hypothetical protein [Prescottella equi]BCN44696.1 hypothetical protein RE9414_29760 [Prescottella equi]
MSTANERTIRAKIAAHAGWSQTADRTARTANARAAATTAAQERALSRLEQQIDPNGDLTPTERRKRAQSARQADLARAQLKTAKAERLKAEAADLERAAAIETEHAGYA